MISNICSYFTVWKILSSMLYLLLCSLSMKIMFIPINICSFESDLGKSFNLEFKLKFIYKILIFTKFSVVAFCEKWDIPRGDVGCVCVQRNSTDSDSVCEYKLIAMVFLCSCTGLLKVILMEEWNQGESERPGCVCTSVLSVVGTYWKSLKTVQREVAEWEHLNICLQWAWILLCLTIMGKLVLS